MCHEDTSSVSQTFKSNHAHTQRTQNEQNQWKVIKVSCTYLSDAHTFRDRMGCLYNQLGGSFRHLRAANSSPKPRSKTRQRFPSEVHTEIRRQHCQISVNTHSQFTLTTHTELSDAYTHAHSCKIGGGYLPPVNTYDIITSSTSPRDENNHNNRMSE